MIIKVCGLRHIDNLLAITSLDINWTGFIFWPGSKRHCTLPDSQLSTLHLKTAKVGVFVNATAHEMHAKALACKLDYLQLHGNESPELCRTLKQQGHRLIKAFPIATHADLAPLHAYEGLADYYLFDTKTPGYGGSGHTFDWSILHAYDGPTPFLLSGGLHPGSIDAILHFHHPHLAGIDLNSGFESAPGLKDIALLRPFIASLRARTP
ncbi:MAG: phosphoribosylanthranilate isomerase [Tannerellaceae bacterium]|jgi:phosphoribosylanthranilate isomerase|nr:phosphoribosylanthranilate isomerase [Tannerellaceae bacterium]